MDNPYAAPATDVRDAPIQAAVNPGGITRLPYFLGILALMVIGLIPILGTLIALVGSPILAWHRLKNAGYHPALGLLVLVPIANIWVGVMCLAAQTGYRQAGRFDATGRRNLVIIVGLIVLMVVALIGIAALGAASSHRTAV